MRAGKTVFWVIVAVSVSAFAVWHWNGDAGSGTLRVTAFDIGQGDAILVRTPHGSDILIDGGPPNGGIVEKLGKFLPPSDRDLELVVATHADSDHIGGLPSVASRYRIERVLDNGSSATSALYSKWLAAIESQGSTRLPGHAGATITIDDVVFDVIWPDAETDVNGKDRNDASVVVRMHYGNTSFLFTGDITSKVESRLIATHTTIDADVLKVGHHGSAYSTSSEFVDAVSPSIALISAGKGNRYGHPHSVVLKRLAAHGVKVIRTDKVGDLTVVSDGSGITFDR